MKVPCHMMIERRGSEFSPGIVSALMNAGIVVPDVQITIVDNTVDENQIMRFISRVDHRRGERN